MSKYTTEIRYICEVSAGLEESAGRDSVAEILQTAAPRIFNFDFPIFDESYRVPLEIKILRHYYTREISEETVGLWKLRLEDRMNMIMPYYNQLYLSELLEFNPLYEVDVTKDSRTEHGGEDKTDGSTTTTLNLQDKIDREHKVDTDTTDTVDDRRDNSTSQSSRNDNQANRSGETNRTDSGVKWDLYSDTPQGGVTLMDDIDPSGESVANNAYLTNARKNTNSDTSHETNSGSETSSQSGNFIGSNNTVGHSSGVGTVDSTVTDDDTIKKTGTKKDENESTTTFGSTQDYIEHIQGKNSSKSYSKLLVEFRETFLNIDKMVIEELSDLFFGLW